MFSFFAALFSAVWISEHWQIVVGVLAALILLAVLLHRRRKARRAAYLALPVIYVGNKATRIYHRPACPKIENLSPFNAVHFRAAAEVQRLGYSPCSHCKP